uniref:Uncharacterized protein n=1 Tax=Avena sativa TaxID=4498 RepID=A0ACD5VCM1_AVESA
MSETSGSSSGLSWSDLPPELLGLVLSWLPTHADRVRIAAVCCLWRSNARLQRPLPSLLPWLALCDGTFLSLPDGAVHQLPVPGGVSSRLSTGGMLFLVHGDGTFSLMNPSPARMAPLPELAVLYRRSPIVRKVVVSDHLIAALVEMKKFSNSTTTKVIISTRGQQSDITRFSTVKWEQPTGSFINDIALFKGKLHILTTELQHYQQELHILDGGQEQTAIHRIPRVEDDYEESWYNPYSTDYFVQQHYLVVSGDRLLMVERRINLPPMFPSDSGIQKQSRHFEVFEAADLSSGRGRWIGVDTLMGHALFVSEGCSESLPAVGQCGDIGVREDCIYFMNEDETHTDTHNKIRENPMLDSGVYNMRDKRVMPLLLETMGTPAASDGPWHPTWLFPET